MRLIDADALIEHLQKDPLFPLVEKYGLTGVIETRPTIDPVRHGHWVNNGKPVPWDEDVDCCPAGNAFCSECGEWLTASDEYLMVGLYCPNCGAKMDEVINE